MLDHEPLNNYSPTCLFRLNGEEIITAVITCKQVKCVSEAIKYRLHHMNLRVIQLNMFRFAVLVDCAAYLFEEPSRNMPVFLLAGGTHT